MLVFCLSFFLNAPAPTDIYTLSLHDALPIYSHLSAHQARVLVRREPVPSSSRLGPSAGGVPVSRHRDRKSTRLNSSHVAISYAVFCLKKKKKKKGKEQQYNSNKCDKHSIAVI